MSDKKDYPAKLGASESTGKPTLVKTPPSNVTPLPVKGNNRNTPSSGKRK
ncbi:hypothetical protein SAMN05428989_1622 [Pseudoxanthomonas sp. GM95]|nr:hypothetical protein SAMN05428989_1622 [Pseudoxanthomonas sp. GM95]